MQSPFIQNFDQLPETLPIFPLEGAVVMPGAQLPLNVFEPRYLNMVEDALASHHLIGMIQPDAQSVTEEQSPLHSTGCAARITSYQETQDGRLEIILSGVCRFDIRQQLTTTRGYLIAVPDWSRFASDYEFPRFDKNQKQIPFFALLDNYLKVNELEIDQAVIDRLPFARLLNVLTTLLPLHHDDKQAIVEAVSFNERYQMLISQFELAGNGTPSHLRH